MQMPVQMKERRRGSAVISGSELGTQGQEWSVYHVTKSSVNIMKSEESRRRSHLLDTSAEESFYRCPEVEGRHLCTESADAGSRCSGGSIVARLPPVTRVGGMGFEIYGIHCRSRRLPEGIWRWAICRCRRGRGDVSGHGLRLLSEWPHGIPNRRTCCLAIEVS